MLIKLSAALGLTFALAAAALAQNQGDTAAGRATRQRTTTKKTTTTTTTGAQTNTEQKSTNAPRTRRAATTSTQCGAAASEPGLRAVCATFDALVNGIRHADVNAVMSTYWNSPKLILFNNNGTVTRGWEQVRENRASSYPKLKDVKLEVRDVRPQMIGPDAALITCLWTQSQTASGSPESASGRLTLVLRRLGGTWKIIHTHTSPDAPDPSRVLPSERTEPATTPTQSKPPTKP